MMDSMIFVSTAREIKKNGTGAKKPCCATGFESNEKKSTVPGRSRHLGKDALELQITRPNADSGALLEVRTFALGA